MTLGHVLNSEVGLTLVTAILGAVWTAFRSSDWYRRVCERRYATALHALEAGVELTYRTYVQAIKGSRADGKLTDDEMRQARQQARDAAIEFGRTQGIDVVRELGGEYIDLLIAKLVKKLKHAGA